MPVIYFIAMLIVLGCGVSVLAVNSKRWVNRVFAGICFICTLYFAFTLVARYAGYRYSEGGPYFGLPWVRLTWTMTALMPFYLWSLFYVVSGKYESRRDLAWRLLPWGIVSLGLVILAWTQLFITSANLPDKRTPGPGFVGFQLVLLVSAFALLARCVMVARSLKGIRKLEFLYLTISCGALSVFAVLLPVLTFLPVELRKLVTIPIVCYGITGWSLTTRRVYHSSHIYLSLIEHAAVIGAVGFAALWTLSIADKFGINVYARVSIVGVFFLAGYYGHELMRRWLRLKPEQQLALVRRRLLAIAEKVSEPDVFLRTCEVELAAWAQTPRVLFLRLEGECYRAGESRIPVDVLRPASGFVEGWVTPASLNRVRMNEQDRRLLGILTAERFAAIVANGWPDRTPALLAAFAERENETPFTYPEIRVFQELADVVEGYYTRAMLRLQARQAEQLAAIGRIGACVAHEMRNPMESLRTFAEMLPGRLDDRAFLNDFATVIPREAERVHALAAQLLDMAKPRDYQFALIDVHAVVEETTRLLMPAARERETGLVLSLEARQHALMVDANALRQVLINLIRNSVDSLAGTDSQRVVTVRTRDDEHRFFIEVEDNGPGVPEDIREKLFTPFATSGKKGGLGLGLAISEEITKSHCGTISADARPGGGSVFRVALPRYVPATSISG